MDCVTIFLILCMAFFISSDGFDVAQQNSFDVVANGAIGDGKTDDSPAFLKTWAKVCEADSSTPTLTIPGKTFLLKPVEFNGPCKAQNINVEISGDLVAPDSISEYEGNDVWLSFKDTENLNILGTGKLDGRGSVWWGKSSSPTATYYPCRGHADVHTISLGQKESEFALSFHNCNGLQLSGLKHMNSPKNHITINGCNGATLSNLNITAPRESPNTDGIDISESTNILIRDSYIGTGDDCVAINGGTSFINITSVTCGPGHGISVGSLGENGAKETVEEVHVKNCTFIGTTNGARIKTWKGGSGYAKKISFEQITFSAVKKPIIIDQYYDDRKTIMRNSDVEVSDVSYIGMQGTSASEDAITLSCSSSVHCQNIVMKGINITSAVPGKEVSSVCANAHGTSRDCHPPVPCLSQNLLLH